MTTKQNERLQQIADKSPLYLSVTTKAYQGTSRAAAIKAKCLDCCGWQRSEITNCSVEACPLWLFRPYQNDNETDD